MNGRSCLYSILFRALGGNDFRLIRKMHGMVWDDEPEVKKGVTTSEGFNSSSKLFLTAHSVQV